MYEAGDHVLLRAVVAEDGRTVRVAPSVELGIRNVAIAAELPASSVGMDYGIVLMFETPADLREFVDTFSSQ